MIFGGVVPDFRPLAVLHCRQPLFRFFLIQQNSIFYPLYFYFFTYPNRVIRIIWAQHLPTVFRSSIKGSLDPLNFTGEA